MEKPVVIGRFGKTYGVKGWVRVQSFMDSDQDIFQYQPWHIGSSSKAMPWKGIEIIDTQCQANTLMVHVKGIDTLEKAKALLTGKEIAIEREQLPALDGNDYYWTDLEGLEVITLDGKSLGHVDYLMESAANDILVVKGQRECLIPYIKGQVIKQVDLDKQQIIVDWDVDF